MKLEKRVSLPGPMMWDRKLPGLIDEFRKNGIHIDENGVRKLFGEYSGGKSKTTRILKLNETLNQDDFWPWPHSYMLPSESRDLMIRINNLGQKTTGRVYYRGEPEERDKVQTSIEILAKYQNRLNEEFTQELIKSTEATKKMMEEIDRGQRNTDWRDWSINI